MKNKRITVVSLWFLTICAAVGAGWFAAAAALKPNQVEALPERPSTIEVVRGEISQSIEVPVAAWWQTEPIDRLQEAGVLTAIHIDGMQEVSRGDKIYDLDLKPVVIAKGSLPLFRALDLGDTGADVAQVEEFLAHEGFLDREPTQKFDQTLREAVRAWQRSLGAADTGMLFPGEILFTADLPAHVAIDETLKVGDRVGADQPIAHLVASDPRIEVVIEPGRELAVPADAAIEITGKDIKWSALTGQTSVNEKNESITALRSSNDGPVCASQCIEKIPFSLEGKLLLSGDVIVLEQATGALVPQAALHTDPQGNVSLRSSAGDEIPVVIVQQQTGQTIVEGVEIGTEVLLFHPGE